MTRKEWAIRVVASNWRIRKRLPRLTALVTTMVDISCNYEIPFDYDKEINLKTPSVFITKQI
jgi:hypothetical protein